MKDSDQIAHILEIPEIGAVPFMLVEKLILKPMRWACAGTILATQEAVEHGFSINLGGGYHHASTSSGGGFCVYSDISLAINHLRESGFLGAMDTIAYIDLDAHQGDGISHTYMQDKRVQIFDMYNQNNFPYDQIAIDRVDWDIPVIEYWSSEDYIHELKNHLPEFLDSITERIEKSWLCHL